MLIVLKISEPTLTCTLVSTFTLHIRKKNYHSSDLLISIYTHQFPEGSVVFLWSALSSDRQSTNPSNRNGSCAGDEKPGRTQTLPRFPSPPSPPSELSSPGPHLSIKVYFKPCFHIQLKEPSNDFLIANIALSFV